MQLLLVPSLPPKPASVTFVHLLFVTGYHCVTQTGLKLAILLPLLPERRDYRREPLCLAPKPGFEGYPRLETPSFRQQR
jgi:hypothetical protein